MAVTASDPRAEEWLREAYASASDPAGRGRSALALGRALFAVGRLDDAFVAIDEAEADLGRDDRALPHGSKRSDLCGPAGLSAAAARARSVDRLERVSEGDRIGRLLLFAHRAYEGALAGEPADGPTAMAREALAGGELVAVLGPEDSNLDLRPQHAGAVRVPRRGQRGVRRRDRCGPGTGLVTRIHGGSCFRSQTHYRLGDVRRAEAEPGAAVEVAAVEGWGVGIPAAGPSSCTPWSARRARRGRAGTRRGRAWRRHPRPRDVRSAARARGRLRIASGQIAEGVADMLACGERQERWGAHNPSVIPWRSMAAEGMIGLGRADEAGDRRKKRLRWLAAPDAASLRNGVARGGPGAAGSRAPEGKRGGARSGPSPLERHGLVWRSPACDAGTQPDPHVTSCARPWTRPTAPAPPRSPPKPAKTCSPPAPGRDGPGYRGATRLRRASPRVASRAADGASDNREIAQSLFVTVKTVETHLGNAYRKLGVSSRGGSPPDALAGSDQP